jgi:hypothetical protein
MLGVYWNCGLAAGEPFVICPSPFEQLARTNHAPIDSETGRIRELILDAENDLTTRRLDFSTASPARRTEGIC